MPAYSGGMHSYGAGFGGSWLFFPFQLQPRHSVAHCERVSVLQPASCAVQQAYMYQDRTLGIHTSIGHLSAYKCGAQAAKIFSGMVQACSNLGKAVRYNLVTIALDLLHGLQG